MTLQDVGVCGEIRKISSYPSYIELVACLTADPGVTYLKHSSAT